MRLHVCIYMKFNTKMGAFLLGLAAVASVGQGALAQAQVLTAAPSQNACLSLQSNFGYGSHDLYTGNAVTSLQNFLASQGHFNGAYIGTGRYGSMTLRAVAQFQAAHGIRATGFVGPLTRAAISQISCGTVILPLTSGAARLYSITPSSGIVGTTVSITGFGFTSDNMVLMDGSVAARNVPITSSIAIACTTNPSCHGGINQTITFTIPSALSPNCPVGSMCPMYMRLVTPATYSIVVVNSNGTSNTLYFTVTGATGAQPLSITGLDTPASLSLGQVGTWTVHVNTTTANTGLHYSVVWGDEALMGSGIMMPQTTTVQSSATFTHSYSRSGNYTPVFTVTDDFGHSVSASNTVIVTPLY